MVSLHQWIWIQDFIQICWKPFMRESSHNPDNVWQVFLQYMQKLMIMHTKVQMRHLITTRREEWERKVASSNKGCNQDRVTYLMTYFTSYISFLIAPSLNTLPMSKLDKYRYILISNLRKKVLRKTLNVYWEYKMKRPYVPQLNPDEC